MKWKALLCAAACVMATGTAWATPVLTLKASGTATPVTVTDESALDSADGYLGAVGYKGRVGNWSLNMTTGTSGIAGIGLPELDLSSLDLSGSTGGTLTISLKDTITGPWAGNGAIASVGGTFNAPGKSSILFQALINGSLVSSFTFNSSAAGTPFSGADPFDFTPTGNDVIELIASITHSGKGSTSFDYALSPVPEPGSMALLGAGLLALALYGKRRTKE